jgi:polynucleotide 5'-hydroxyl-kinase GRC3/NOL9
MQTTLVIGATDRGKTTLVSQWARALAADSSTFVLDADTGQSEIGPPGCVGLARAQAGVERLSDLKPEASFFVGALTPSPAALEHVLAVRRAADTARALGAERLLIDTPGWIYGPGARRWLAALAQSLLPATVAGVGVPGELDGLLKLLQASSGATIENVLPPEGVGRKPPGLRATRRVMRLSKALSGSRELALPLDALSTLGATLGTGTPLPPELLRWSSAALKMPVAHTEQSEGVLSIYVSGPLRSGWESLTSPVAYHFKAKSVRVFSLHSHDGVLLGLQDGTGKLLGIGRFAGLDTERGELLVTTPLLESQVERIALIAFGRIRCAPDGSEIQDLKPGEL